MNQIQSHKADSYLKTPQRSFLQIHNTQNNKYEKADRFIPNRDNNELASFLLNKSSSPNRNNEAFDDVQAMQMSNIDVSHANANVDSSDAMMARPAFSTYKKLMADALFGVKSTNFVPAADEGILVHEYNQSLKSSSYQNPCNGTGNRILQFNSCSNTLTHRKGNMYDSMKWLYSAATERSDLEKATRMRRYMNIPLMAERVLDLPDFVDDFYLNLLDWSGNNMIAVALSSKVYLYNAYNSNTELLTDIKEGYVSSVSWMNNTNYNYLAIGKSDNSIEIWDVERGQKIRELKGHSERVSSLAWNYSTSYLLSSGSRDSKIINHDLRSQSNAISTFSSHTLEVCGLKWSYDGLQLASGGNDNLVCIWDISSVSCRNGSAQPRLNYSTQHKATVKALAWAPWQKNLLATGSGFQDKNIRLWNTSTGALVSTIETPSQVCDIVWNPYEKELISAQGSASDNLLLWRDSGSKNKRSEFNLKKMGSLNGHNDRVVNLAMSPQGSTVVSACADETLRFWKVSSMDKSESIGDKKCWWEASLKKESKDKTLSEFLRIR